MSLSVTRGGLADITPRNHIGPTVPHFATRDGKVTFNGGGIYEWEPGMVYQAQETKVP